MILLPPGYLSSSSASSQESPILLPRPIGSSLLSLLFTAHSCLAPYTSAWSLFRVNTSSLCKGSGLPLSMQEQQLRVWACLCTHSQCWCVRTALKRKRLGHEKQTNPRPSVQIWKPLGALSRMVQEARRQLRERGTRRFYNLYAQPNLREKTSTKEKFSFF